MNFKQVCLKDVILIKKNIDIEFNKLTRNNFQDIVIDCEGDIDEIRIKLISAFIDILYGSCEMLDDFLERYDGS